MDVTAELALLAELPFLAPGDSFRFGELFGCVHVPKGAPFRVAEARLCGIQEMNGCTRIPRIHPPLVCQDCSLDRGQAGLAAVDRMERLCAAGSARDGSRESQGRSAGRFLPRAAAG